MAQSVSMAAGSQQGHFRFLDLPPELRNEIYEMALHDTRARRPQPYEPRSRRGIELCADSITRTCRQLRIESLPYALEGLELCFDICGSTITDYVAWSACADPQLFHHVRKLMLRDYQHYHMTYNSKHPVKCACTLSIDLKHEQVLVAYDRDEGCKFCPLDDEAAKRIRAVVQTLQVVDGRRRLTKAKLWEVFEAAAWPRDVSPMDWKLFKRLARGRTSRT